MGIHDRPYMQPGRRGGYRVGGMGGLTFGLPRPARAVKVLLLLNAVAFVLQIFLDQPARGVGWGPMSTWLGVTVGGWWQPWRYVTFQFLHAGVWHIVLNMLGLYFLGSPLERHYGTKRFVAFYLSCGAFAGLAYVVIGAAAGLPDGLPIIGASGGVYGIVLAAAVYFPGFRIIFLFFPVPIRLAAIVIFGAMLLTVLRAIAAGRADAVMSDVAHLGGAVLAAAWIWLLPRFRQARLDARAAFNRGAWERKMRDRAEEQAEVDRILKKIHDEGIASLSAKEKRYLQEATRRQRDEEGRIYRL
jgi:membrane associated rhomboid family serine protease